MLVQQDAPPAAPPRRFAHYDLRARDFERGPQVVATAEAGVSLACAVIRAALSDLLTSRSRARARRFLLEDFQSSVWAEWLALAGIEIRPDAMAEAVAARCRRRPRGRDAG